MKAPIFVALDVNDKKLALDIAEKVSPYVQGFKIGPRLVCRNGLSLVQELASLGEVFVDHKFYDIPSTMISSVSAVFEAGATYTTIHASCGKETLAKIANLEFDLNKQRNFKVLGVTVLTSYDEESLPTIWEKKPIPDLVMQLAHDIFETGMTGLVCSSHEAELIKGRYAGSFLVTPGVRLPDETSHDQKRVMTPSEALTAGANMLVVGRPIVMAPDPAAAAQKFQEASKQR